MKLFTFKKKGKIYKIYKKYFITNILKKNRFMHWLKILCFHGEQRQ